MKAARAGLSLALFCRLLRRPGWRVAGLGGLALAFATPAAAQMPCTDGPDWGEHNVGNYHFSYLSRQRGNGAGAASVHCVRNRHASRAVFVDWRGAGLRSAVPPDGTIFRTSPVFGAVARRPFQLFYGARPNEILVPTLARAAPLRPGWAGPAPRRLSFWQDAVAAASPELNLSVVYLPVNLGFLWDFANNPGSEAALIEWLESHPRDLGHFIMTFDNRVTVDAQGQAHIRYTCVYRMPAIDTAQRPLYFLRFTDAALHRQMFGRDDPFPIQGWGGEVVQMQAEMPPVPGGTVAPRTAQLEILLGDRNSRVAVIPIAYPAPRGS